MLVLTRTSRESVVIGDEVKLTVEEICNSGDGQRIVSAKVRLGFESPRQINIYRSELRPSGAAAPARNSARKRAAPRPGRLVPIADAQVRLRIQVPRAVPVRWNGSPPVAGDTKAEDEGAPRRPTTVHHITCSKNDRITICNNITIAALDFRRFVPLGAPDSS